MAVANQANTIIALKAQSGLGTAATGTGATGIEVLPSQGLALSIAAIESQMIQRSRMRKRPRHGSRSATASYETELQVGNLDTVLEGVLGGTWTAAQDFDETDWGALTISGTGVTLTFASGTILTDGVAPGMMARLTNMSESDNNSKWFPILGATETVLTIPTGILIDNASDAEWDITIAKSLYTATPYTDRYFTVQEHLDIDRSKIGTDMRLNNLNLSVQPEQFARVGFGLMGRDLDLAATGDSPTFTDPTFTQGESLTLLDGGLYIAGSKRTNVTGVTFGLAAPVTTTPVVGSNVSPDISLGQFAFTGQFTIALENGTDWDAMDAETQISAFLHFAEQGADTSTDFVSVYVGNLTMGGFSTPAGGEGAVIATFPLMGGEDERGGAYLPTTMLVSTSAA